jgi:hypothetical protein
VTSYDDDFEHLFNEVPATGLTRQDVQREVLNTLAAVQQASAVNAQRTQAALERAEKEFPGITAKFYSPEVAQEFLSDEKNKRLAERLAYLQNGYGDDLDYDDSLRTFHNRTLNYEIPAQAQPGQRSSTKQASAGLSLQKINALPLEQRRAAIEALGNRVANVPLDEADSENSRYKAERGES